MRNIELKARLKTQSRAREIAHAIGATPQGDIRQTDTYFNVPSGRLKLRVCEPGEDYLVFYHRPNEPGSRASDYWIEQVSPSISDILSPALGVLAVVRKVRTLFLWENVRIHLDRVDGLGDFLEFEAVLDEDRGDADGHEKVARLRNEFGISNTDLVSCSYLDLILEEGKE